MSKPRPVEPMVDTTRFQAAVRDLPVGPWIPHLTREFIHKCLDDMTRMGLVPPPPA
jgi:fatty acid CoA ligase FadD9